MKVIAVGANPDDVEFLCAGTLAACARRGDAVAIACLTTGDKSSATLPPARIYCMRTAARYRGYQCGVRYAEGFIPERVYSLLSPRRLLP